MGYEGEHDRPSTARRASAVAGRRRTARPGCRAGASGSDGQGGRDLQSQHLHRDDRLRRPSTRVWRAGARRRLCAADELSRQAAAGRAPRSCPKSQRPIPASRGTRRSSLSPSGQAFGSVTAPPSEPTRSPARSAGSSHAGSTRLGCSTRSDIVGAEAVLQGQAGNARRSRDQRQPARDPAQAIGTGLSRPDDDAVLLRSATEPSLRSRGDRKLPRLRAVLRRGVRARAADSAGAQPVLRREPAAPRRSVRHQPRGAVQACLWTTSRAGRRIGPPRPRTCCSIPRTGSCASTGSTARSSSSCRASSSRAYQLNNARAVVQEQPQAAASGQLRDRPPSPPRGRGGPLTGRPTDQHLPPIMAGFRDAKLYPLDRPDLRKARALARGSTRVRQGNPLDVRLPGQTSQRRRS